MDSVKAARRVALSLPSAEGRDHFGSPSFRVGGKIFVQLSSGEGADARALVKLTPADQAALIMTAPTTFASVPQWGRHGWTHIRLAEVEESILRDLFVQSWRFTAPRNMVATSVVPPGKKNRRGG